MYDVGVACSDHCWFDGDNNDDVTVLAGWIFFLVVNAYYAGALTMFFTSSPSIPFETLRQVIKTKFILRTDHE